MPISFVTDILKATVVVAGSVFIYWLYNHNRRKRFKIITCRTTSDWASVSDVFFAYLREGLLGVDCEWVSSAFGPHKVALLQLSPNEYFCILIRLTHMEIPPELKAVLAYYGVLKFGVGITEDAKKLKLDHGIEMHGCLDLRYMALEKDPELKTSGSLSLANLGLLFGGMKLNKKWDLRTANWEAEELSVEQIRYAGADAVAGLVIAKSIIRDLHGGSLYDSCLAEFEQLIDVPFRGSSANGDVRKYRNEVKHVKELCRSKMARSNQEFYSNAVMKAPDGDVLCTTNVAKVKWYLKMNMATLECENPLTIRLNFEPRGRPVLGGEYYADARENICVVCGTDKFLGKKNVVPLEYRKLFPEIMKAHTSHDTVLTCVDCHRECMMHYAKLRAILDIECPNEAQITRFQNLRCAARALLKASERIPVEKKKQYIELLQGYFGAQLSPELLKEILKVSEVQWLRQHGLTHAQRVVNKYAKGEGLFALEIRFRNHFVDTMRPNHISPKWSFTHNHDVILMKMAVGRYAGTDTYDEFLRKIGVSWGRVADLVVSLVNHQIVEPDNIVIWDQLREAGYDLFSENAFGGTHQNR